MKGPVFSDSVEFVDSSLTLSLVARNRRRTSRLGGIEATQSAIRPGKNLRKAWTGFLSGLQRVCADCGVDPAVTPWGDIPTRMGGRIGVGTGRSHTFFGASHGPFADGTRDAEHPGDFTQRDLAPRNACGATDDARTAGNGDFGAIDGGATPGSDSGGQAGANLYSRC